MARKLGQIIARGPSTWLVRIYQGRAPQTGTRKYLNQTIRGSFREAQRFLNLKLQQRDLNRTPRVPDSPRLYQATGWQPPPHAISLNPAVILIGHSYVVLCRSTRDASTTRSKLLIIIQSHSR
jgi:hypothetical protein